MHSFLGPMSPPNPKEDLVKENRSLYQRVDSLQRNERDPDEMPANEKEVTIITVEKIGKVS